MNIFKKIIESMKSKKIFVLLSVLLLTCILLFLAFYLTKNVIVLMISVVALFCIFFVSCFLLCVTLKDMANTLLDDYRLNHNLFSGAVLIMLITSSFFLVCKLFSMTIDNHAFKDTSDNIATFVLAIAPAFISILGVHYSNSLQQISRQKEKEDLNTPYLSINYLTHCTFNGDKKNSDYLIDLTINNLADNICIPLYFDKTKLDYQAINGSVSAKYSNISMTLTKNTCHHVFYQLKYKDIFNRIFSVTVEIVLDNMEHTAKLGNPKLVKYM